MMLDASWFLAATVRHRLALGLECLDAMTGVRINTPLSAEVLKVGPLEFGQFMTAKGGGLQMVHYAQRLKKYYQHCIANNYAHALETRLSCVRLAPTFEDKRSYVPRRLRITLKTDANQQPAPTPENIRRPWLWPGAAYPVPGNATGVRGRAAKGSDAKSAVPLRWVRVLASIPASEADLAKATIVGQAHGDDRGEFLLLIEPKAIPTTTITGPLKVRLTLYLPPVLPPPDADTDPLWDVPLEDVGDAPDSALLQGKAIPPGFAEPVGSAKQRDLTLGQVLSGDDFLFLVP